MATRRLADTARSSRSYEPSNYQCALFMSNGKPVSTLSEQFPRDSGAKGPSVRLRLVRGIPAAEGGDSNPHVLRFGSLCWKPNAQVVTMYVVTPERFYIVAMVLSVASLVMATLHSVPWKAGAPRLPSGPAGR